METRMTEQQTPPPAEQKASPKPEAPKGGEKQPPWGDPENFNAEEAWKTIQNLRKEKGGDPALRGELEQLRQSQEQQRNALASALGVKPEETSDSDKLAQQIETLRGQIVASERRALAVEFKVPEAMLTAADAAAMREQAAQLVEFAQGAHYAALTTAPGAQQTPPPPFQHNPGQGQGNTPLTPEALAAAEYEKYYPTPTRSA